MSSDLEAQAARLLCVGFHGRSVSAELVELVRRGVRSVVLFSRNVGEPHEVAELTAAIHGLSSEPIVIAVDQEGGSVRRLRSGFTELPPFRSLGNSGDAELARSVGALLGRELRAVGIDWNFAPVLDVDTNPQNPVIGQRALSHDAAEVARLGVAFALGQQSVGLAACAKHFPGHGDTELDSHRALPRCLHSLERLKAVELVPFAAAARAGIASMMSAHVVFTALDPLYPATLSRALLHELMYTHVGYTGLLVSDDLEMQAISDHFGIEEALVLALRAGVDVFLTCHSALRMNASIDALIHALEDGRLQAEQVTRAARRVEAFSARWASPTRPRPALSSLRSAEHLALAEQLAGFSEGTAAADPTLRRPMPEKV